MLRVLTACTNHTISSFSQFCELGVNNYIFWMKKTEVQRS
jgi:hypothetical protein